MFNLPAKVRNLLVASNGGDLYCVPLRPVVLSRACRLCSKYELILNRLPMYSKVVNL